MANQRVSIMWYCKTEEGYRRFPVIFSSNGRIKKGAVKVKGEERSYPVGQFHLRWLEGKRSIYEKAGTDSSEVLGAQRRREAKLQLQQQASALGATVDIPTSEKTLRVLRAEFMEGKVLNGISKNGLSGYNTMLDGFFAVCRKGIAAEVTKDDVLRYLDQLRRDEYADHTIFNRCRRLISFLKFSKVPEAAIPNPKERPKKPVHAVEVYNEPELRVFFDSLTAERDALVFETFLKTGLRERELTFLEWPNLDFHGGKVKVRNKADLGFRIKDCEERDVPLDPGLKEKLVAWKKKMGDRRFVFGTAEDRVEGHFLRTLKIAVRDAGLNCGLCPGCREQEECGEWYLHKFRATFATSCIRSRKVDLPTLQKWMGHNDLEPTMRYLRAVEDDSVHATIAEVFSGFGTDKVVQMPSRKAS